MKIARHSNQAGFIKSSRILVIRKLVSRWLRQHGHHSLGMALAVIEHDNLVIRLGCIECRTVLRTVERI